MWLLTFVPDGLIYAVTGLSFLTIIVTFVLGHIPIIGKYAKLAQLIACVLFILGVYLSGGISNEASWKEKVAEMELAVAKKEVQSAEATTKVVTKYIETVKIVKEKGDVIIKEVPKYITKESDAKCPIPNAFVVLHDSASKNEVPDSTRLANEGTSATKLSTVTETVVGNYSICHQNAEQLKALQTWIREQEIVFNK
jgi:apolipoprotein N-acyltransferase